HAGSDIAAMRTTARLDGGTWVLNGEKCYVTNGGIAELTLVFARTDAGISAFLVEGDDPGVSAGRKEDKIGLRASHTGSVVLAGAGIMRDHPVEKWLRDAKVFQIVEGTSEIQRHVIAGYLRG